MQGKLKFGLCQEALAHWVANLTVPIMVVGVGAIDKNLEVIAYTFVL